MGEEELRGLLAVRVRRMYGVPGGAMEFLERVPVCRAVRLREPFWTVRVPC